nr:Papain-like cysteine peptidase [Pandoravirus belohorizontensis]
MDFGLPSPRVMAPRLYASTWDDDDRQADRHRPAADHHRNDNNNNNNEKDDDSSDSEEERRRHAADRGRRRDDDDDKRRGAPRRRRRRAAAVASLLPAYAPPPRAARAVSVSTMIVGGSTTMALSNAVRSGSGAFPRPAPMPYLSGDASNAPWTPPAPLWPAQEPFGAGLSPYSTPVMSPAMWPAQSPQSATTPPLQAVAQMISAAAAMPSTLGAARWPQGSPDTVAETSYGGSWQPQSYSSAQPQPSIQSTLPPSPQPPPSVAVPSTALSVALGATPTFIVGQARPSLTLLRSSPSVNAQYQRLLAVDSARLIDEVKPPANFDGRKQWNGLLSPVLDQGQCGGCWAFSSAGVLGDRFAIHTKGAFGLALSPEHLILCGFSKPLAVGNVSQADRATIEAQIATLQADLVQAHNLNQTFQGQVACYGNTLFLVSEYLYRYGTRSLRCDPYTLNNAQPGQPLPPCRSLLPTLPPYERCKTEDRIDRIYRAIGRYYVSSDKGAGTNLTGQGLQTQIEAIKAEIYKFGPIMAGYEVFRDFMQPGQGNPSWATGIYRYDGVSAKDGGHAIAIVGWGTDPDSGETFWIIRNSWGVAWGEAGYFRMYAGQCGIEHNTMAVIPDLPGLTVPAEYVERFIVDEDSVTVRALVDVDPSGLPAAYVRGLTPAQRATEAQPIVHPAALPQYLTFVAGRIDNPHAIPGAENPLPVGATRFVTPSALGTVLTEGAMAPNGAAAAPLSHHATAPAVPVAVAPSAPPLSSAPSASSSSLGAANPATYSWAPPPAQPVAPNYAYAQATSGAPSWQPTAPGGLSDANNYGAVPPSMPWSPQGPYYDDGGSPGAAYFAVDQQQQQEQTMMSIATTTTTVDYGRQPHRRHGVQHQGGCAPGPLTPPPPAPACGPCSGGAGPFPIVNAIRLAEACAGHGAPGAPACPFDAHARPTDQAHGVDYRADVDPSRLPGAGIECTKETDQHPHDAPCTCVACRAAVATRRPRKHRTKGLAAAAAYVLVPVPEPRAAKGARRGGVVAARHRRKSADDGSRSPALSTATKSSSSVSSTSTSDSSSCSSHEGESASYNPSAFSLAPSSPSSIRLDPMSGDLTSDSRRSDSSDSSDSGSGTESARARRRSRRRHRRARQTHGRRR